MAVTVYGYGRASKSHQVLSTDQQHAKVTDAFALRKANDPLWRDAEWGGWLADESTGRESCFRERHCGSLILAACKPGDVIAVSNFDRLIAGVRDAVDTMDYIHQHKINLWILDFGGMQLDTTTPMGETFFVIMAQLKRLEVLDIRRRTRESKAHRKRLGRPFTQPVLGWKHRVVRVPGIPTQQRYLVPDNAARRLARELVGIKCQLNRSYTQASQYCNSIGLKQRNGKRWTIPTFVAWCRAAENNFPLPNGSHEACPIPADAIPVIVETISPDD